MIHKLNRRRWLFIKKVFLNRWRSTYFLLLWLWRFILLFHKRFFNSNGWHRWRIFSLRCRCILFFLDRFNIFLFKEFMRILNKLRFGNSTIRCLVIIKNIVCLGFSILTFILHLEEYTLAHSDIGFNFLFSQFDLGYILRDLFTGLLRCCFGLNIWNLHVSKGVNDFFLMFILGVQFEFNYFIRLLWLIVEFNRRDTGWSVKLGGFPRR